MKNHLKTAIALMEQAGYDEISERLRKELDALNADTYKIAVVGEFKAGKSSLINRVFLKEDILFTDIMEATAVPTEICYGEERFLEVIPYVKTTYKEPHPFDKDLTTRIEISGGEGKPVKIPDPGSEEIKAHTSADTPEKRSELAGKTARVKLHWPAGNLFGLTLFDTPGINSVNEAVIATTYRIIPETDLVLFVTTAKQLSSVEMEFLSGRVFSEGITRAITVVTSDADADSLSDARKESLLNSIRSQLANIGREYVPVEMVSIRNRPAEEMPTATFKERVDHSSDSGEDIFDPFSAAAANSDQVIGDVLADLLGEQPATPPHPASRTPHHEKFSVPALEEKLVRFIRENVRPGRIEKMTQVLKTRIQLALVQCAAELSAMNKSENERREMLEDIRASEMRIRLEHEALSREFRDELRVIQLRFVKDAERGLDRIARTYTAGFDACDGLGELQYRLNHSEIILKAEMEEMFLACSQKAGEEIKELVSAYGIRIQVLLSPWQTEISRQMAIDGGFLSKIPPFAIMAVDILLFLRFGPFGALADILIRFLANYVPYLNKIMPATIAGGILKKRIKESLRNQFDKIKADLPAEIEKAFRATSDRLFAEWQAYTDEQLDTVRKIAEKAVEQPADQKRRELLDDVKAKLEGILGEIRACPSGKGDR